MKNDTTVARSYSARELVLMFLGVVALCGVFFSLGFLVGFKEKNALPDWTILKTPGATSSSTEDRKLDLKGEVSEEQRVLLSFNGSEQEREASSRLEKSNTTKPTSGGNPPQASFPRAALKNKPKRPRPTPSGYAVQVVALRAQKDAESVRRALKVKNYRVFIVQPQYSEANDNLFRVQVGPFLTRVEAEKTRDRLAQEGFNPFIRR